ncbi:MAG: F0F1 ATP synthase subunit epsilon [Myxococcaceae bacterium]|nr:F0F1 ATP synthase subunit epsilon [Myxococcaceae bacterium]MCI0672325.1 F0F1 ATP synthase subunit epsilon [Myxococcaceae bacterium]
MAKLTVEIVTPERRILSVQADEVVVPGAEGLFGVRPRHTAYLALMQPGPLTVREGGSSQVFFVAGGFAEVSSDKVLVLADQAEPVGTIDVAAAEARLVEAQKRLAALAEADARYEVEMATVRRESARIAASGRR